MLKITFAFCILLFSVYAVCIQPAFASVGADNTPRAGAPLEKKTVQHLQAVLVAYQEIYRLFAAKETSGLAVSAGRLADTAKACMGREAEDAVVRVMQHVIQGAEELINAEDAHEIHGGFASISNALFLLFKLCPNQVKSLEMKLYWCEKDGYYWLQPQKQPPVCPYGTGAACSSIKEVK